MLGFASTVYADGCFWCGGGKTKEECCAVKWKMYCSTAEVCAHKRLCQKIDEDGCYTCDTCHPDCVSPKRLTKMVSVVTVAQERVLQVNAL